MNNGHNGTGAAVLAVQAHVPAPPSIDRQMLLASFAASVMTGLYAHGDQEIKSPSQLSDLAMMQAALLLQDFEKKVGG